MWLLLIVAFLSTSAFYRSAKSAGLHPDRAASTPFLLLGALLILSHITYPLLSRFLEYAVNSGSVNSLILTGFRLALGLAYIALLARNWLALSKHQELVSNRTGLGLADPGSDSH